jgi:hypothetical protein
VEAAPPSISFQAASRVCLSRRSVSGRSVQKEFELSTFPEVTAEAGDVFGPLERRSARLRRTVRYGMANSEGETEAGREKVTDICRGAGPGRARTGFEKGRSDIYK